MYVDYSMTLLTYTEDAFGYQAWCYDTLCYINDTVTPSRIDYFTWRALYAKQKRKWINKKEKDFLHMMYTRYGGDGLFYSESMSWSE